MFQKSPRGFVLFSVVGLVLSVSPAANGQAVSIDVASATLGPGDSTAITVTASYDGTDYAVAGIETDLVFSAGCGGLSDLALVAPMDGPGTSIGVLVPGMGDDDGVTDGILAGQLNFPVASIYADDSNPIAFYTVTYTAPIDIARPFLLDVMSSTSRFDVYVDRESSRSESRLGDLAEGRAEIHFIPAPTSAAILGMGGLALTRRRRG